jgi:hypothetical protein
MIAAFDKPPAASATPLIAARKAVILSAELVVVTTGQEGRYLGSHQIHRQTIATIPSPRSLGYEFLRFTLVVLSATSTAPSTECMPQE